MIISRIWSKSKGFIEVGENMSHSLVGDEPRYLKIGDKLKVAVSEKKKWEFKMTGLYPNISCVLLDDAFQHRKIKPDFQFY